MDQKSPFFPQLSEIAAIKTTILKQPGELHGARLAAADADRDVTTAKRAVKDVESQIADQRAEVDALVAGDTTLKNEVQRKACARELLKANPAMAALDAQLAEAQLGVTRAEMAKIHADLQVRRLEDEQRSWRAHLDATQCEVQLLVAGR